MEPIDTSLQFIRNDARFERERPYAVHMAPDGKYDPADARLTNIEFEDVPVKVHDMRLLDRPSLDVNGFQRLLCDFSPISINDINEREIETYQFETEKLLRAALQADKVICYDHRFRRNSPREIEGDTIDVNHPYKVDLPPRGVHNITFDDGPQVIKKVLRDSRQDHWLNRKYRYRIVNTWRPLLPKLEDRPLAFCDYQSLNGKDLIAADQIYGKLRRDIYYLRHNPNQRWYWMSSQTPKELTLMLMYDTKPKYGAQFCPHVSFENPAAGPHAPPRESIETRSIVISRATSES